MPASLPGWQSTPGPWNRATIGGYRVPGKVEVSGRLSRRDDTADVPGMDGATMTVLGYAPAEFTLTVTMWTDDHVTRYHHLFHTFRPTKGDKNLRDAQARAVRVEHPAIAMAGLEDLTIYEMSVPEDQGRQIFRATILLKEFIPEIKRSKTAGTKEIKNDRAPEWNGTIGGAASQTSPRLAQGALADMKAKGVQRDSDILGEEPML